MTTVQTDEPTPQKPLRLWPGVVIAILLALVRFGVPAVASGAMMFAMIGGMAGGLAIVVWWVFLSRAPWSERLGAIVVMIVALFATSRIVHESIRGGMMGMMLVISATPVLGLALVAWAVATRRVAAGPRRAAMVATILLACGVFTLLRTDGITGAGASQLAWRWTETREQRLLARAGDEPVALPPAPAAAEIPREPLVAKAGGETAAPSAAPAAARTEPAAPATRTGADWPGFRGAERNSIIRGVRIATDWSASPPAEMWRRPIGPGWSSFAVRGDLLYTQE